MSVNSRTAPRARGFAAWLAGAGSERAWINALLAFVIGAVFAVLLRNLGVAGVVQPVFLPTALLTGLAAAIGFGSVGRMFTRRRSGWLLALTVIPWGAIVVLTTFVVFSRQGNFEAFNPTVPAAGGLVAGVLALLPYKRAPRIIAIVLIVIAVGAGIALVAFAP